MLSARWASFGELFRAGGQMAAATAALALALAASAQDAPSRALTDAEWRADLQELAGEIRETHPRPFAYVEEAAFDEAVTRLDADIPNLGDHAVMLRLAEIVNLVSDGHTRLALPRAFPERALEFGHSANPPPTSERLNFSQLPLAFRVLSDGVFVIGADEANADLIGAQVLALGGLDIDAARTRSHAYAMAENAGARDLNAADRLALPELLAAIGARVEDGAVEARLRTPDGAEVTRALAPLAEGARWSTWENTLDAPPLHAVQREARYWIAEAAPTGLVYARLDEMTTSADAPLTDFIEAAIARAEAEDARLVIDLRANPGGRGDLNRAVVAAIIQSEELNQWGRVFVLIGPMSFSASQLLINELERYTRALFIGEPSGARPDHYGDSRRVRLANSGLTLRISTLHWSSPVANDPREATAPHMPAAFTSETFFAGRDPALEAAQAYPEGRTALDVIEAGLRAHDIISAYSALNAAFLSTDQPRTLTPADFLEMGQRLVAEGETEYGGLAYRLGLNFFRGNEELLAAYNALEGG